MTTPVRLAKRLAETVPCSRRAAELYIAGGWVTVDGQVVEEPQFMVAEQKVELLPNAKLVPINPVTILFHQPPDADMDAVQRLIRPDTQSADDRSGIHVIKQHFARLKLCLPLEQQAGGLAGFTQDYKVVRKLTDEYAQVEQE